AIDRPATCPTRCRCSAPHACRRARDWPPPVDATTSPRCRDHGTPAPHLDPPIAATVGVVPVVVRDPRRGATGVLWDRCLRARGQAARGRNPTPNSTPHALLKSFVYELFTTRPRRDCRGSPEHD